MTEQTKQGIVSLLIPAYKHENTIVRALDSILQSDCAAIELVISDDASPDGTFEVAQRWLAEHGQRFHSARAIKQPRNLGITGNLNYLLAQAGGDFVTLLASDDEITPRAIDVQKQYLLEHPDKDFVFANFAVIDGADRVLAERMVTPRRAKMLASQALSIIDIVFNWGPPWSRLFARRQAFAGIGQYIAEHSFDDRWSGLKIVQTRRFGYLDVVVQRYRVRGVGTATGGIDQERLIRDMQDVEQRLVDETTGLLKLCLLIRTRGFRRADQARPDRLFWRILSGGIGRAVHVVFGDSMASVSKNVGS